MRFTPSRRSFVRSQAHLRTLASLYWRQRGDERELAMGSPKVHMMADHQRMLVGLLPLAEEASRLYGWKLNPAELEALVLPAAPGLSYSRTALEARLSLWATYQQRHTSEAQ